MLFKALAQNWWTDSCPYCREESRNGRQLSHSYISTSHIALVSHILPAFGDSEISDISAGMVDEWKYSLHEQKGLSFKSANNYLSTLKTMFNFWWRHGIVTENPCLKVRNMSPNCKERGILSDIEVVAIFSKDAWEDQMTRLASLTAASTGMRMGEIQALRSTDIEGDRIVVAHSWDESSGLKSTKTRSVRCIPVPHSLATILRSHKDGFIFSNQTPERPAYRRYILDGLKGAMEQIGISREEQTRRGLCFHSWRHWLNTKLRLSGVPDAITQSITGHATQAMTERYSHIATADLDRILAITNQLGGNQ